MDLTNSTSSGEKPCYNPYGYKPALSLTVIAAVCWGLFSLILLIQTIKTKKKFFLIVPIAGFMECFGYILRIPSGDDPCKISVYILSYLFILVPPTCLVMGNYTLIGMIIQRTGVSKKLTPRMIRNTFLTIDGFCLFIQMSGGGIMSQESMFATGQKIMLAGISIALGLFIFFLSLVIFTHYQVVKHDIDGDWKRIFTAFYLTVCFVIVRSVYRLIEFAGDFHNDISTNEAIFYSCDCLVLLFFLVSWIYFHPSRVDFEGKDNSKILPISESTPRN